LASIVIFAARSEASVYLGGRSYDSLGQVLVFHGHHLIDANPGLLGHAFGLAPLPAFLSSSFAFSSTLAYWVLHPVTDCGFVQPSTLSALLHYGVLAAVPRSSLLRVCHEQMCRLQRFLRRIANRPTEPSCQIGMDARTIVCAHGIDVTLSKTCKSRPIPVPCRTSSDYSADTLQRDLH
jgi:hypothetical protein